MRSPLLSILLFSCLALAAHAQPDKIARIDQLLKRSIDFTCKDDSTGWYTDKALEESQKAGYIHGIAEATTCKSFYILKHTNDCNLSEQIARQSLDWFARTPDKTHITYAYYVLGFTLLAQSRFEESIHYTQLARDYAQRDRDTVNIIRNLSLIGCTYRESGDYEAAFGYLRRSLQMAEETHHPDQEENQYFELAALFIQIEDYPSAKKYFHAGFQVGQPQVFDEWRTMVYAELLSRQGLFDSALYYYNRFDSATLTPALLRTYLASKGEYHLLQDRPREALPYFEKSLIYQRQLNDRNQIMRVLKDLSLTYERSGRDKEAARYARESLAIAEQFKARQYIRDICQILYTLYDKAKKTDSAYAYYRRWHTMKDSVNNDHFKGRFASAAFEQKIALLSKEKQLNEVCLRETLATKKLLIVGIIATILIGFIFSRYVLLKRKNETHLRKRAEKELEIAALRSQMNPHFIFNCLNAINRFILGHETEAASDYLTKFSRLMRMIMNHSRHSVILLTEELEVLQLYLDMERLRFKDAFDYNIVLDEELDAGDIYIPPLLLQPFVENAIWHGLMHKMERGILTVSLSAAGDVLTCIIQDNGVGRQKAGMLKSKSAQKHKSMGLQITAERLRLMTGAGTPDHSFNIEDLYNEAGHPAGTRVVLKIKIHYPTAEQPDVIQKSPVI